MPNPRAVEIGQIRLRSPAGASRRPSNPRHRRSPWRDALRTSSDTRVATMQVDHVPGDLAHPTSARAPADPRGHGRRSRPATLPRRPGRPQSLASITSSASTGSMTGERATADESSRHRRRWYPRSNARNVACGPARAHPRSQPARRPTGRPYTRADMPRCPHLWLVRALQRGRGEQAGPAISPSARCVRPSSPFPRAICGVPSATTVSVSSS